MKMFFPGRTDQESMNAWIERLRYPLLWVPATQRCSSQNQPCSEKIQMNLFVHAIFHYFDQVLFPWFHSFVVWSMICDSIGQKVNLVKYEISAVCHKCMNVFLVHPQPVHMKRDLFRTVSPDEQIISCFGCWGWSMMHQSDLQLYFVWSFHLMHFDPWYMCLSRTRLVLT